MDGRVVAMLVVAVVTGLAALFALLVGQDVIVGSYRMARWLSVGPLPAAPVFGAVSVGAAILAAVLWLKGGRG